MNARRIVCRLHRSGEKPCAKDGESEAMLKEKAALSVGADLVMNTEAAIRKALEAHSTVLSLPAKLSEKP